MDLKLTDGMRRRAELKFAGRLRCGAYSSGTSSATDGCNSLGRTVLTYLDLKDDYASRFLARRILDRVVDWD